MQLKQEAQRKDIPLEKYFTEYFDLKEEFKKFLPWFPFKPHEPPLTLMLKSLRLNFVGRHHAGLDDCHSIASVVKAMIRQGCKFDTPTVISPTYDYSQDPSYVSFSSKAPPDSWKCAPCSEKYRPNTSSNNSNNSEGANNNNSSNDSTNNINNHNNDDDDVYLAVWNKPNTQACRFCGVARPFDINQGMLMTAATTTQQWQQQRQRRQRQQPPQTATAAKSKPQLTKVKMMANISNNPQVSFLFLYRSHVCAVRYPIHTDTCGS